MGVISNYINLFLAIVIVSRINLGVATIKWLPEKQFEYYIVTIDDLYTFDVPISKCSPTLCSLSIKAKLGPHDFEIMGVTFTGRSIGINPIK